MGDTAAMPGAKVVAMACAHMRRVFTEHRNALKNNIEYCRRSRDPWHSSSTGNEEKINKNKNIFLEI